VVQARQRAPAAPQRQAVAVGAGRSMRGVPDGWKTW
jgi:hypothetical protein